MAKITVIAGVLLLVLAAALLIGLYYWVERWAEIEHERQQRAAWMSHLAKPLRDR